MSIVSVSLIEAVTGQLVDAVLHTELTAANLGAVEAVWGPTRQAALDQLLGTGHPDEDLPEHWHWDWNRKADKLELLACRCLGIEINSEMQGLMMVTTAGHNSRLAPDRNKPLVYIDYLEVAPWNLKALFPVPRYKAVGVRLMEAAIRLSQQEEFKGRVGLHALPQAERFYRGVCGMTYVGSDPRVQNLPYYEMTQEQALVFLGKSGGK